MVTMGRHHWAQDQDPLDGPEPTGRFRLLLGSGALICVVLAVLGWLAASLLLSPRGGGLEPLAEVPLTGSEQLTATPDPEGPDPRGSPPAATPEAPTPMLPGSPEPGGSTPAPTAPELVIHVAGAVGDPGIYKLPTGTRAYEAIDAAGGLTKDADVSALNLAAVIQDATRLYVPRKGEVPGPQPPGAGSGVPGTTGPAPPGPRINVNTADAAALQGLPGIGPTLAGNIIAFRTANGDFATLADLDAVSGIGPVMLKRLEPLVGFR